MPIALVSLVGSDRQCFKSRVGLLQTETPRDISFCGHAIVQGDVFIVPDAQADERFADNPFVVEDPHVRFYAGAPLYSTDGYCIGTLCIIDHEPKDFSNENTQRLRDFCRWLQLIIEKRFLSERKSNSYRNSV